MYPEKQQTKTVWYRYNCPCLYIPVFDYRADKLSDMQSDTIPFLNFFWKTIGILFNDGWKTSCRLYCRVYPVWSFIRGDLDGFRCLVVLTQFLVNEQSQSVGCVNAAAYGCDLKIICVMTKTVLMVYNILCCTIHWSPPNAVGYAPRGYCLYTRICSYSGQWPEGNAWYIRLPHDLYRHGNGWMPEYWPDTFPYSYPFPLSFPGLCSNRFLWRGFGRFCNGRHFRFRLFRTFFFGLLSAEDGYVPDNDILEDILIHFNFFFVMTVPV